MPLEKRRGVKKKKGCGSKNQVHNQIAKPRGTKKKKKTERISREGKIKVTEQTPQNKNSKIAMRFKELRESRLAGKQISCSASKQQKGGKKNGKSSVGEPKAEKKKDRKIVRMAKSRGGGRFLG